MDSKSPSNLSNVPSFKSRKMANTLRKRAQFSDEEEPNKMDNDTSDNSDSSSESVGPPEMVRLKLIEKRKQLRGRNLIHTTSKKRRKEIDTLANGSSSSEDDGGKNPTFDPDVKFGSSGIQRVGPMDMGATARSEVDTEYSKDSQSQFERIQEMLKKERKEQELRLALDEEDRKKYGERAKKSRMAQEAEASTSSKPKIYRGMAVYGAKEHEDTIKGNAASGLNRIGPIRATQYMRASVRWDYAPDICKDYKETGFCTFGDSCKFMHDRSDYKHGWEIERDWEAGKLKEAKDDEYLVSSEGEEDDDKLPHSCYICRDHFKQPVVTKCKHYFCESCALKHYQKSKKCAICGEKTDGVFNVARDILAKMKAMVKTRSNEHEEAELNDECPTEEAETKVLPMAEQESGEEFNGEDGGEDEED